MPSLYRCYFAPQRALFSLGSAQWPVVPLFYDRGHQPAGFQVCFDIHRFQGSELQRPMPELYRPDLLDSCPARVQIMDLHHLRKLDHRLRSSAACQIRSFGCLSVP